MFRPRPMAVAQTNPAAVVMSEARVIAILPTAMITTLLRGRYANVERQLIPCHLEELLLQLASAMYWTQYMRLWIVSHYIALLHAYEHSATECLPIISTPDLCSALKPSKLAVTDVDTPAQPAGHKQHTSAGSTAAEAGLLCCTNHPAACCPSMLPSDFSSSWQCCTRLPTQCQHAACYTGTQEH